MNYEDIDQRYESREGDFSKLSQSALEHYDEIAENEGNGSSNRRKKTPNSKNKIYYEPKSHRTPNVRGYDEVNNMLLNRMASEENSEKINISNGSTQYQGTKNHEERKIPKGNKKTKKKTKNNKFLTTNTVVEKGYPIYIQTQKEDLKHASELPEPQNPNDSVTSNQSSLNRSLKLQQRKQRKQMRNQGANLPSGKPTNYSGMQHLKTIN